MGNIISNKLKKQIISIFGLKTENEIGELNIVSLSPIFKSKLPWFVYFKRLALFSLAVLVLSIFFGLKGNYGVANFILIVYCLGIMLTILIRFKKKFFPNYRSYEPTLQKFIYQNNLYEEDNGQLISEIRMAYIEEEEILKVIIEKNGDSYQKVANQLREPLESKLSMSLYEVNDTIDYVEYIFMKFDITREQVVSLPKEDDSLLIKIYGDFKVSLMNNYSMLISGASGAGKSYFTYFYLTRFISQKVNGKHANIMAIDPKQSDLYKLFKTVNMPTENYGTSNADAFRIVKHYLAEMEHRMALYDESSAFDSVGIDIGLEPTLLVIEEYSSLVASMDSKQKKEFENMVAIIAQKSRSLSMGILIVMQQPRADSLSSNIREQLQNSVFLGNPSKESAGMMFGTTDVPHVRGKGVGMYAIERSAPKSFESPQFEKNVFETILPVWQHVAHSYNENL
ncbi:FtsK/SpoIIIE protein [Lactococcus piscium]|uniref:FtsK/SpoIIIE protein n=1 Tax=Pseudolactococcus piscium TaxID=1364 RepID=A0A2A5S0R5_9LACT|nr:FtsK/SpoIIIE domain-containing protein [Lactococcus piscium]PCS07030.1 FtsK/SpoIIIE protein [Lactococcus piscium]